MRKYNRKYYFSEDPDFTTMYIRESCHTLQNCILDYTQKCILESYIYASETMGLHQVPNTSVHISHLKLASASSLAENVATGDNLPTSQNQGDTQQSNESEVSTIPPTCRKVGKMRKTLKSLIILVIKIRH